MRTAATSSVTSTAMAMIIEINSLNVRFRRGKRSVFALRDVSLGILESETLALIGESGSGKTTLGRTIVGLETPCSGSIRFADRELVGLPDRVYRTVRRDMAMIFQDAISSLSPRRTVHEQVIEPFRIHRVATQDARRVTAALLQAVGLNDELLDAYPHELSGGQGRRVGIARALALEPKLIVADEPTAGLDVSVQGEIVNLLRQLQTDRKSSCLFITHNLAVARQVSERVGVLYKGWLCETGPTERVLTTPAHPYTQLLLRSASPQQLLHRREGAEPWKDYSSVQNDVGCPFQSHCPRVSGVCRVELPAPLACGYGQVVRCHFPLQ
jgi:peptide/nickel transport system ATP-binding protein